MSRRTAATAALIGATCLLATACSSDPPPVAGGSTTSSPSPSATTTATTPTPSTTSSTAAGSFTDAGAKAAARHYFDSLNLAWTTPDPSAMDGLGSPTCKSCASTTATASELKAKGQRYLGNPATVNKIAKIGAMSKSKTVVHADITQERRNVVDSSGSVVLTDRLKRLKFEMSLEWLGASWQVSTVKVIL